MIKALSKATNSLNKHDQLAKQMHVLDHISKCLEEEHQLGTYVTSQHKNCIFVEAIPHASNVTDQIHLGVRYEHDL